MNEKDNKPVFFDETKRRGGVWQLVAMIVSFAVLAAAVCLWVNIYRTPTLPLLSMGSSIAREPKAFDKSGRHEKSQGYSKDRAELRAVLRRSRDLEIAKNKLEAQISKERGRKVIPVPQSAVAPGHIAGPVRAAFYVNWDKASLDSLAAHINLTTHLLPVWLELSSTPGKIMSVRQLHASNPLSAEDETKSDDIGKTYDEQAIDAAHAAGVAILPVLQNSDNDQFRKDWLHTVLSSEKYRKSVIASALNYVQTGGYQGINIDFETDNADDTDNMTQFMAELATAFHSHGLIVTQDIETDSDTFDDESLAKVNDFIIPMLYDEHSSAGDPGALASIDWFKDQLQQFLQEVPANKLVLGYGCYGYDWSSKNVYPDEVSFQDAVQIARESLDGDDGVIRIDPNSLSPNFTYWNNDDGASKPPIEHHVWLADATTLYDQMLAAEDKHVLGDAIWRLGTEDPSIWSFFGKMRINPISSFNPDILNAVKFDYFGTQFQGQGDILNVIKPPSDGKRSITVDPKTKYITSENYLSYPSQNVIRRTGLVDQKTGLNTQKIVALTFDDGPDPRWTPKILDILQRYHLKATFFVVGIQAESHPGLVEREWNMGMEIGNHSYTHPDQIDNVTPMRLRLELDATQRVIEAITGHETTIFRAPNIADSEPRTPTEFEPVNEAGKLGYTFIGEVIDPTDWRQPAVSTQQIINAVVDKADQGNCILLHDAGGESRQETIDALPVIIQTLLNHGYKFVTVSELMGKPRSVVYPEVPESQRIAVEFNRIMFKLTNFTGMVMNILFLTTIFLGIVRVLFLGSLAIVQSRHVKRATFKNNEFPPVSVVIAAFNEAKVINKTIATLLTSSYPDVEIVVVDDGSTDGTADVVELEYGGSPQVKIIRKENGGKASALNIGIASCRGEIVVALDADTIFARDTITKLVRHFEDKNIGAVAGNVKVGNRGNLLTLWQAIEYITSQNFDRRAYHQLNCITVVPGAVGAWRKDAILKAGGYSSDTLAEDTDLTFKIRRMGYRSVTDNEALAYTEVPDTLKGFAKQRFRWAFGTLQCLWKHRSAMFKPRYGAFGMVALPSLWIYQIGFQVLAPIVDLMILWTAFYGYFVSPDLARSASVSIIAYWGLFSAVDMIGAALAFRLDYEDMGLLGWLLLQRFVYRQMMYYVVVKSVIAAIHGQAVGWGKLDRKGTVTAPKHHASSKNATSEEMKVIEVSKANEKDNITRLR